MIFIEILSCEPPHFVVDKLHCDSMPDSKAAKNEISKLRNLFNLKDNEFDKCNGILLYDSTSNSRKRSSAIIATDRIDIAEDSDISSESIWTLKEIKRAKSRDGLAKALDAFPLATQNRIVSEITKESSIKLNSHLVLCEILWQHFQ